MTENDGQMEEMEISADHSWVEAAMVMEPAPVPSVAKIEDVEIEVNGNSVPAGLLSVVTPAGVTTVFLTPNVVQSLVMQGAACIEAWQERAAKKPGLVIADKAAEASARLIHQQSQNMREKR